MTGNWRQSDRLRAARKTGAGEVRPPVRVTVGPPHYGLAWVKSSPPNSAVAGPNGRGYRAVGAA
jgi:hypothetical protein